ncbi:MAG TPA: hypothetical protein PKY63_08040 [Bacteroidales bacterium]|nr:hypothetical protein [Bacteroidales bacterium]
MRSKLQIFFLTAILGIAFFGCIEQREYPIEPAITFKSFATMKSVAGHDSIGYLTIEFTDGDGDVGLAQSDTLPPYNPGSNFYYNFFITFFQKTGNDFQEITTPYNSRIPDVNPEHIDKDLVGDISIEIDLNILSLILVSDTIKMKAYMLDRALNESNMIETPAITLDFP